MNSNTKRPIGAAGAVGGDGALLSQYDDYSSNEYDSAYDSEYDSDEYYDDYSDFYNNDYYSNQNINNLGMNSNNNALNSVSGGGGGAGNNRNPSDKAPNTVSVSGSDNKTGSTHSLTKPASNSAKPDNSIKKDGPKSSSLIGDGDANVVNGNRPSRPNRPNNLNGVDGVPISGTRPNQPNHPNNGGGAVPLNANRPNRPSHSATIPTGSSPKRPGISNVGGAGGGAATELAFDELSTFDLNQMVGFNQLDSNSQSGGSGNLFSQLNKQKTSGNRYTNTQTLPTSGVGVSATLYGAGKDEYGGGQPGTGNNYGTNYGTGSDTPNQNKVTLKCWSCKNVKSFEDCEKYGREEICMPNQVKNISRDRTQYSRDSI